MLIRQLCDFWWKQVLERSCEVWGALKQLIGSSQRADLLVALSLWPPQTCRLKPLHGQPAPLPSIPYLRPFLSFLALSCLCLFLAVFSSLTPLFSCPPKWPPKDSHGFQSFVTAESSKISKSKRYSIALGGEHFY